MFIPSKFKPFISLRYRCISITKVFISIDCLRDEFKKQIKAEQFNCTLPWIQSMQGVFIYNDTSIKTCNDHREYENVSYFGYEFAQNASTYSHLNCPGTQEIRLYIHHKID